MTVIKVWSEGTDLHAGSTTVVPKVFILKQST
jgi:hypothetical protein